MSRPASVTTDERAHHARQIREANEKVVASQALLEVRVIAAREAGIPWQVIADAMGLRRQSVCDRFSRLPELGGNGLTRDRGR